MKLQIKTLSQKSLMVDIDLSKTVYELKKELSLYPDVGVKPELQKLIYAGKILFNEQPLSAYNIDAKKFLVVMVLKQPEEVGVETSTTSGAATSAAGEAAVARAAAGTPTAKATEAVKETPPPPPAEVKPPSPQTPAPTPTVTAAAAEAQVTTPQRTATATVQQPQPTRPTSGVNDEMVANIVCMGYPEVEVRRALAASFNNPERAIEYLIEGIPESVLMQPENALLYGGESDADVGMSPFEMFRSDPLFRNLRRAIQQHPDLINDAIQRVGEANPAILQLINENQQEFLSSLIEGSDDDDDDDEGAPGGGTN
ncbi:UV excision repair protein RAD23 homolog B [Zeugodacus cucurbitae]|uniref:UV excision repair protein RAD23 homolog B n=1 Tax=Zeugodacus cucurbitae TaxID=28588 RepID=A0A0A1X3K6_ZEUCU|nr:UV excision repair protein RAD23 homolog B [Zeugodacus cucurbitae]